MSKLATELSTQVGRQVGNINWTVTGPLVHGRRHICVDVIKTLCKSCGAPTHIFYVYDDFRYEPLCHDCAWPKNGEYLREKEEERQKEQEKAKTTSIYDGCCTVDNPCSWHDGN